MKKNNSTTVNKRRDFLRQVAAGAATVSIASLLSPLPLSASPSSLAMDDEDPDAWFNKLNGKHKIVYDVPEAKGMMPFAWSRVFLLTNEHTGTPEKQTNVVVVLRHNGIAYAMENRLWEKYNFGEMFDVSAGQGKGKAKSNMFWQPKPGDFTIPGIGQVAIGINELQDSGVMFCVCDMALTVMSAVAAKSMNKEAADVKKDWVSGILPGIQIVPSGVWAVGRAQEHGCGYCFAG
ncbi:MAG: twin-arginine translocation signal domain-containing protein [Ginsengibacter sp.]